MGPGSRKIRSQAKIRSLHNRTILHALVKISRIVEILEGARFGVFPRCFCFSAGEGTRHCAGTHLLGIKEVSTDEKSIKSADLKNNKAHLSAFG